MSVSIINPGVSGITVETDPTALKLTGGTLTGRVVFPNRTSGQIAYFNLGTVADNLTVPTTLVEGDIFFHDTDPTGGYNVRLAYTGKNFSGTLTNYSLAVLQNQNFFTQPQTISCSHNSQAALRVTQTGNSNAFVVEDSSNPDDSCLTIDSNGRLNINVDASTQQSINTYADLWVRGRVGSSYAIYSFNENGHGIYSNVTSAVGRDAIQASGGPVRMYDGMAFNNDGPKISIPSIPVVATGTYDKELGITIAGVNYRIPCRTV